MKARVSARARTSAASGSFRASARYFVMTMKTKDDVHEFENLEKKEWDGLVAFLQEQGVKSAR